MPDFGPHNPIKVVSVTFDPASVAANTVAEQDITVTGIATDDVLLKVTKPTTTAGFGIVGARIKAANTVAVAFSNNTAAPIDAASESYQIVYIKA